MFRSSENKREKLNRYYGYKHIAGSGIMKCVFPYKNGKWGRWMSGAAARTGNFKKIR